MPITPLNPPTVPEKRGPGRPRLLTYDELVAAEELNRLREIRSRREARRIAAARRRQLRGRVNGGPPTPAT